MIMNLDQQDLPSSINLEREGLRVLPLNGVTLLVFGSLK
jgi:hypothetical protein